MQKYYDAPTQVRFYSKNIGCYIGGIAYKDKIICGCCGYVFEIEDVINNTPNGLIPIRDYKYWESCSELIMGDEGPEPNEKDADYEQLSIFNQDDKNN